jgi:hypothetical protein
MTIAVCHIELPAAPAHPIPQVDRLVHTTGTLGDAAVPVSTETREITLRADPGSTVTVEVRERIANGAVSEPVTISFVPYNEIKASKADGAIRVVSVVLEADAPTP